MASKFKRASGILLHPTSLGGDFGIGELGDEARSFIDFLAASRQTYWQILPLGPTGYGDSPYNCFSAFAGNTLLISPRRLLEDGLVESADLADLPHFDRKKVDFGAVYDWKNRLLLTAYNAFRQNRAGDLRAKFETFCRERGFWLDDYSLYRAVKADQGQRPWYEWPEELKLRDEQAVKKARAELGEQIVAEKFYQFIFFRQWSAVREYANQNGIKIIGDVPIFVALDSADVWCSQGQFKLNADGSPTVVAGVPPDYFSATGQLWGNPIYDWEAMRQDGFSWWIARVYSTLALVDVVRADHFRGFAAAWEVPGGDKTAENGSWVEAPGAELFTALTETLGDVPMIAEDLGVITPDVDELRETFKMPGMRILQYAFGGDAGNQYLPHNYIHNCVAYTGTHDNDTAVGWFNSLAGKGRSKKADPAREHCLKYLNSNGKEINWDMIRAIWASVADTAIAPVQDLLGLGNEARMNLPASNAGNWSWRMPDNANTAKLMARLREMTEIYGRANESHDPSL